MTKPKKSKRLTFAPLVRVSTERQRDRGESMKLQVKQCAEAVEKYGGVIPKRFAGENGKFVGQEHSTPDKERVILDQLIKDCSKNLFDAVIVSKIDRLGRDADVNKHFFKTLRSKKIRFFTRHRELDLYKPHDRLMLGIEGEISQFFGLITAEASMENRIELAEKGCWAGGPPPYGRIWLNKKEHKGLPVKDRWKIDPDKQAKIMWAAEAILDPNKPLSVHAVARKLGMHTATLYRIFRQCGNTHHVKFESKLFPDLKYETDLWIPPLLDDGTLQKLDLRFSRNKTRLNTFTQSKNRNFFPLKGFIRCEHCGYNMFGLYPRKKNRYYQHNQLEGCHKEARLKADEQGIKKLPYGSVRNSYVPADRIELKVMTALIRQLGSKDALKSAFREAVGVSVNKGSELEKQLLAKEAELDKIENSKQKLIDMSLEFDNIDLRDINRKMGVLKDKEAKLKEELCELREQLQNIPTEEELARRSKRVSADLREAMEDQYLHTQKGSEFRKKLKDASPEQFAAEILKVPELAHDILLQLMPAKAHGIFIREDGRFVIKSILPQKLIGGLAEKTNQIRSYP